MLCFWYKCQLTTRLSQNMIFEHFRHWWHNRRVIHLSLFRPIELVPLMPCLVIK